MFERLSDLADEYARLEHDLADAAVHSDPERARALGRRYGELTPLVHAYQEWQQTGADEEAARELAAEDHSFAAEAEQLAHRRVELEEQIRDLLAPRDASDSKDVLLEVKAGEGGEESALFAADLLRALYRAGLEPQVEFFHLASYFDSTVSSGTVKILRDIESVVRDRDVLLVDDILESGRTLAFAKDLLTARGARRVLVCTMLEKPGKRAVQIDADFVGFVCPDVFVVGYGMDVAHCYRELPFIGRVVTLQGAA